MVRWNGWPEPDDVGAAGSVVTMGVFDGLHRGHQALVSRTVRHARRLDLPAVMVTFDPHPLAILRPDAAPRQLMHIDDRVELALATGLDGVAVLSFDRALADTPADLFVDSLIARLGMRRLVVGANFACGRGGAGDVRYLRHRGLEAGFEVEAMGLVTVDAHPCSSTEVRRLLASGDLAAVRRLLGRRDDRLLASA